MLFLEQTERVPTSTQRPRQRSDILDGITPQGHPPWLQTLLKKTSEDHLNGMRHLPWFTRTLVNAGNTLTWTSATNTLTIK